MFDASAPSQLSSAGEARAIDQKKLKLILDNILALISVGLRTYAKVIRVWTNAMSGFESLLQWMPLQVPDSAILLALSAWQWYLLFKMPRCC
jgi:hypothetical protein